MKDYITVNTKMCMDLSPIAFLDGTDLPETECTIFKNFVDRGFKDVWALEELYDFPERLMALKYLKPNTIVVGTTCVKLDRFRKFVDTFLKIGHIPNNIILTHGGKYFIGTIKLLMEKKSDIKVFSAHGWVDDEVRLIDVSDDLNALI